jgi:hypothetical protein
MRAVNLIPSDQRGGTSVGLGRSQGGAYAVLAMVAGLALMAVLYGRASHEISSRQGQASTLEAKTARAQSAIAQLTSYTAFVSLRQQRAQAVATLVDSRFDWAHAFHELGRVLPRNASITSLTGTIAAGAPSGTSSAASAPPAGGAASSSASSTSSSAASTPTPAAGAAGASTPTAGAAGASSVASATPPGSVPTFILAGCATSQSVVAETINRLRLIDGVSNVTLQSSVKSGGGGAGSGGGCAGSSPAFSLTVAYQPMPVPAATTANGTTVAATSAGTAR